MSGLLTHQIDFIIRSGSDTRTKHPLNYIGTLPCDKLSDIKVNSYPTCLIANADNSNEKGSHWLSVYVQSPNEVNFFDSYAEDISKYKDIEHFVYSVSKQQPPLQLTDSPLQGETSDVCGHWCILFIRLRSKGLSFNDFVNIFNDGLYPGVYDDFVRETTLSDYCSLQKCPKACESGVISQGCKCKYLVCCSKK
jgi:hypothetical protein